MSREALAMSETAASSARTEKAQLDAAVDAVRRKKTEFARLPVREKIALINECIPTVVEVAAEWAAAGAKAKQIPQDSPTTGEEWLAGPMLTIRNLRLLANTLEPIARGSAPPFGRGVVPRDDGRLLVRVFPTDPIDGLLYQGFSGEILFEKHITEDEARKRQASFYKRTDPEGGVTLVLGAGNVSSIGPMDAFYKLFAEGNVCVLKMNPVNEYLGPIFERALSPLIRRDYLRIVYGGADVGAYLCEHEGVDDIHITGSDRTYDAIVWGPPGQERERRKAGNDPVLKTKTISSELGNVSPVIVVPGNYTRAQLAFQAASLATMIANNGSFNCNAAKMVVTAKNWAQKDEFFGLLRQVLADARPRHAYYPGAHDRYCQLTEGRKHIEKLGTPSDGALPWTLIFGLDPNDTKEPLFTTEPFCAILSHVELEAPDAATFLDTATDFANERLWGTLNATIVIHPKQEKEAAAALDRAKLNLRYGTVAINHWPALGYGFVSTPWGAHPSSTPHDIQSGSGWVHNSYLFEGIEKGIIRGPLTVSPKPPWFITHGGTHELGPSLVRMEADPGFFKIPGILLKALKG